MSEGAAASGWMDEHDPEMQCRVTCHVELEIERGATFREILSKAAWGLRTTALEVEGGKLDAGFHPITNLEGEKIGEVYIDYHGTM